MSPTHLSRRAFLRLSGVALGGTSLLSACTTGTPITQAAPSAEKHIRFWNTAYATTDPLDKTKARDQYYIYKAIQRFEAQNPGVKVDMQVMPGSTDMFTAYRVASIARTGPDVMTLWSGSYLMQFKHYLEPLNHYFTPEESGRIRGWNAVTEGFTAGQGTIYGVPCSTDSISAIYYSKKALAKAGIKTDADWPHSFDDFLRMLKQVQSTGITPLALFDNGYSLFSLDYWIAQVVNGDAGIADLIAGKRKFASPELLEVVQKWQQLAQYTIAGAPTMGTGEAQQLLYQGHAAMMINGPWSIDDMSQVMGNDLGVHKLPDYSNQVSIKNTGIGGSGNGLIVSQYSQHKEEAVRFVKFLMSQPEQTTQAETSSSLSNVVDVDMGQITKNPIKRQLQQWALEPDIIFWPDNIYPSELTTELTAQAQLAWTGKSSAQQFLQQLDAKRDQLLAETNA
ncbi:ABC transporter substrate-binding protein [Dictyobacter kobayashii]|uniref:ABC transporter substrate-binding protein n=1 Tax=Dictyobacter kobayashii TaxID=2014872 RepID=A0A402ASX5_9CHLR|nr:extracellular solute-binding protein [Dictyobacter kobayashii]GCE22185.1 ABC transporter substrate-binding protein [Dictyobacter kobayashii]